MRDRNDTTFILSLYHFYHSFIESKQQEHRRRYFFPIPGHSVAWSDGEYLCPLCQTFSNTILPLSPSLYCSVQSAIPTSSITLDTWRDLIGQAVDQAIDGGVGKKNRGLLSRYITWNCLLLYTCRIYFSDASIV